MKDTLIVLGGALVGAVLGYFAYGWLLRQGFYALALPGGMLGLGASFGKSRSLVVPVVCGLGGLAAGILTEWSHHFSKESLLTFLQHLPDLQPFTLLLMAIGALLAFWIPFRRVEPARERGTSAP